MTDFLLELRSEEIPARMQAGARADLEKLFLKSLESQSYAVEGAALEGLAAVQPKTALTRAKALFDAMRVDFSLRRLLH